MPLPPKAGTRQTRAATFERGSVDLEARTASLAASSETLVERYWGGEILGHDAGEVRTDFINSGTAPLLLDHDTCEIVGVIEGVTIDADRKMRATVRFGKSARAEEVMQDVADGIRCNVSVGYEILEARVEREEKGKPPVYRVTDWRPLEISLVSIPADMTVGVGRSEGDEAAGDPPPTVPPVPIITQETRAMPLDAITPAEPTPDQVNAAVHQRIKEFLDLGTLANATDKAHDALRRGLSIEQFRGELIATRGEAKPLVAPPSEIGLSSKEVRQFSLARYLLARADNNPAGAPLEFEASRVAGEAMARAGFQVKNGQMVPFEVMDAPIPTLARGADGRLSIGGGGRYQRDLGTGSIGAGGAIVQTAVLDMSFIEMLRNALMVRNMGATILGGLIGNIAIPRQTGATTANWVAQGGLSTESDMVFAQVTMSPKTVHAVQDFSREMLLQGSPDIEGLVRTDLALVVALALDLAALHGAGASNQPTGLAATAGIGSVAGGTNGLIPTWDNVVDLETQVANANAAVDSLGYLTNTKVRGRLKRTPIITGQPVFIWGGMPGMAAPSMGSNPVPMSVMNEYRAGTTNQVASNLVKGASGAVCSAIFFGNWRDLLIGEWGGLETLSDNLTQAANRVIRVHAYQTADVAVRKAQSFAAMLDALTP